MLVIYCYPIEAHLGLVCVRVCALATLDGRDANIQIRQSRITHVYIVRDANAIIERIKGVLYKTARSTCDDP